MIAPDELAHGRDPLACASGSDVRRYGAPLGAVEPAVRSPAQAVDNGVSVLQAEAFEMHFGIAIGHIILVAIEQEIRRIEGPDAAPATDYRRHDVQAVHKGRVLVEDAVALGILVNGDLVLAAEVLGRRRRHLVVDDPPIDIPALDFQTRRVGILQVLHHPHAAPLVEIDKHRLADDGLGKNLLDFQIGGDFEAIEGFGGRQSCLGNRPCIHQCGDGQDDQE